MERGVVFIRWVVLDNRDDSARTNKAGQVVNMAVRIVAGDAAVEPQDFFDAKIISQHFFQILPGQTGITLLKRTEQAFLRG